MIEQRMTPAQIAEAQKLARNWKPTSAATFLVNGIKPRTSSLGAARPLPPSADIGPGGQSVWSSCAILLGPDALEEIGELDP